VVEVEAVVIVVLGDGNSALRFPISLAVVTKIRLLFFLTMR